MHLRSSILSLYNFSPLSLLPLIQSEVAQKARKSTFGGVFDRKRVKSQGARLFGR